MEAASIFTQPWVPHLIFAGLGILSIYEILKYKIRNDPELWQAKSNRAGLRAASDPEFRAKELADCEKRLSQNSSPTTVHPFSERELGEWRIYPSLMLVGITCSAILLYIGLFYILPREGLRWHIYAGWILIVAVLALYLLLERNRAAYDRARQLQRKYILQDAGKDPKAMETLPELLEYFPEKTGLWLELAAKRLNAKRYPEALTAAEEAEKRLAGGKIGELEAKFLKTRIFLADGFVVDAEKELDEISTHNPRRGTLGETTQALYRAAIALKRDKDQEAREIFREAREKDPDTVQFLLENHRELAALRHLG